VRQRLHGKIGAVAQFLHGFPESPLLTGRSHRLRPSWQSLPLPLWQCSQHRANDQRIRMQLPTATTYFGCVFEFFKLGVDSGHARDQANQRASDIRAKALFPRGIRRYRRRLRRGQRQIEETPMGTIWRYLGSATRTKTRMDSSHARTCLPPLRFAGGEVAVAGMP